MLIKAYKKHLEISRIKRRREDSGEEVLAKRLRIVKRLGLENR